MNHFIEVTVTNYLRFTHSFKTKLDWVAVDHSDLRTIHFGMKNAGGDGDLMMMSWLKEISSCCTGDEGVVNEDGTLTVAI